jgi:hypothetical protein
LSKYGAVLVFNIGQYAIGFQGALKKGEATPKTGFI